MEWIEFHMHITIVGLLKVGHSAVTIHTPLRLLKVNKRRVYYVKKLFKSLVYTVNKNDGTEKYQEMQPCHYNERSNIHDPFSNHCPRESIF